MTHNHINTIHLLGEVADQPGWRTTQKNQRLYFFRITTRRGTFSQSHQIMVVDENVAQDLDAARLAVGAVVELTGELQYRRKEMNGRTSVFATVVVARPEGAVSILAAAPSQSQGAAA